MATEIQREYMGLESCVTSSLRMTSLITTRIYYLQSTIMNGPCLLRISTMEETQQTLPEEEEENVPKALETMCHHLPKTKTKIPNLLPHQKEGTTIEVHNPISGTQEVITQLGGTTITAAGDRGVRSMKKHPREKKDLMEIR